MSFYEFVLTYWKDIVYLGIFLLSVVICAVKKRPVLNSIDSIKEDILEILPSLIIAAEGDGNGQLKKSAVVEAVQKFVKKKYLIDLDSSLLEFLSFSIESILSTPEKKRKEIDYER